MSSVLSSWVVDCVHQVVLAVVGTRFNIVVAVVVDPVMLEPSLNVDCGFL